MKMTNIIAWSVFACTAVMALAVDLPIITEQPQSQIVREGDSAIFGVETTGVPVDMSMLWVNPGTFIMGSPEDELGRRADETQHQVTLTKGFWLGKYEITQAQYKAIMGTNPSGKYGVEDNYPVYGVTWYDATNFCAKLTEIERDAGRLPEGYEYTLPTEAQWEYACRAGTTTALNSGNNISNVHECPNMDNVGWYYYNSNLQNHSVGEKQPNNWGFYDMHGSVPEWCLDWYGYYTTNTVTNPTGPNRGKYRISRGGSWYYYAYYCRSARRGYSVPSVNDDNEGSDNFIGFRVALVPVQSVYESGGWDFDIPLGDEPIYQWYKDGSLIYGASSSTYEIPNVRNTDAGNYSVTIGNIAGSVSSEAATLTVIEVSGGIAFRSVVTEGTNAIVTINVEPKRDVKSYFVEEEVPDIGTIIPQDGGVYTPSKGFIRWSFLDNNVRKISYTVNVSTNFTEVKNLSGKVTFDTVSKTITGDTELDFTDRTHPADLDDDFDISTLEASVYVTAWKYNKPWSRDPKEIPMTYAAKASVIWVHGGEYTYDICKLKPACWNYLTETSALLAASSNMAKRTIKTSSGKSKVSIQIDPAVETSVYLVEEKLSAEGKWTVSNISDGGNYVPEKKAIRWSFSDNAPRTLTYTLEPPEEFIGNISLIGEVIFDDEILPITGDSEAYFGIALSYEFKEDAMILTFGGTLESSEDGIHWTALDATSPYRVIIGEGKKFFRSVK